MSKQMIHKVQVRLSDETLKKMDRKIKRYEYESRSHFIRSAIRNEIKRIGRGNNAS
jgi:Arc/MetJ-type ribon-helix-helix transcriptional regulator